ncbi:hypothetical protein DEU56DRAFT_906627 [Suillus clintonianus]|uniref:uncharacterized protein n=1 Tax=Suillus clintonianus TaxID=1904413 RepID=UPI001B860A5B|nr:uncharacterized protein DEU56DRAFT_906627 [Suillus clintonianus]KAG2155425.1 hypothetical protein DEU56DRAFT_906627 [Suillus clintonianus]
MAQEKSDSVVRLLSCALHRIRTTPPRIIASPATQPRRAAVAIIIRVVPPPNTVPVPDDTPLPTLNQFFELDWVKDPLACPEFLLLRRDGAGPSDAVPGRASAFQNFTGDGTSKGSGKAGAHVAFPGGRTEEGDEGGSYTAMRQTWEEIGLDLAERDFLCIGQLDDREITTSLGKRLLMILSPFVFLQLTPNPLPTDPTDGTTIHWVPLETLASAVLPGSIVDKMNAKSRWSSVTVDAASRLTPRRAAILKILVRVLIGSMQFPAILLDLPESDAIPGSSTSSSNSAALPNRAPYPPLTQDKLEKGFTATKSLSGKDRNKSRHQLKLWGLSLGMTLDLMATMIPPPSPLNQQLASQDLQKVSLPSLHLPFHPVGGEGMRIDAVAPSLASVFPRFSYPDVNFWIWVFGKRYREVVRGWEASVREGGSNVRRVNWSGTALNTFYAAVRKALLVVLVLRAIGVLVGLVFAGWWVFA